jgi:hypothetical protein
MYSYLSTAVKIKLKPDGTREFRVRNTFGGDRSDYSGPTKADAGDIETFKLLANAVVSDPHSRMMTLDIKDFYLNELLEIPEYMMVKLSDIPAIIIERYGLLAWPTPAVCCLSLLKNSLWIEAEWYDMSQRPGRSPGQTRLPCRCSCTHYLLACYARHGVRARS